MFYSDIFFHRSYHKYKMSLSSLYDGVGFGGDSKEKENMGLDASQIGK